MKNWIKKQFVTEGFLNKWFVWSFAGFIILEGCINFYQSTYDSQAYLIAGVWQIAYAAVWLLAMNVMDHSREMSKMHWDFIGRQQKIIDEQQKLLKEADKIIGDIQKTIDKELAKRKEQQEIAKPSTKKGFTLIELLVVIAIIGILGAILLASFNCEEAGCGETPTEIIRN